MTGSNIAVTIHLALIPNAGIPKSETGSLTNLLINIFSIKYASPAYIIPPMILHIPVGIFIIAHTFAMSCAIICTITNKLWLQMMCRLLSLWSLDSPPLLCRLSFFLNHIYTIKKIIFNITQCPCFIFFIFIFSFLYCLCM